MANIGKIPRDLRLRQNHTEFMSWIINTAGFWEDKIDLYVAWCNWLSIDISQTDITALYDSSIKIP